MRNPSHLRKTVLFIVLTAWVLMVLFTLDAGDESLIVLVLAMNLFVLFGFIVFMVINDHQHNTNVMSRFKTLMHQIFKTQTGIESCLFTQFSINNGSFKGNHEESYPCPTVFESTAMQMGLHYPSVYPTPIQHSRPIRHSDENLHIQLDAKGRVVDVSDDVATIHKITIRKMRKYKKNDIHKTLDLDNPYWFEEVLKSHQAHATGRTSLEGKNIRIFWLFKLITDENRNLACIEAYGRRMTAFTETSQEMPPSQGQDKLTGLKDAKGFYGALDLIKSPENATAFFIDIDGFSKINDYYGYAFGDLLLKKLADSLKSFENDHTLIGRVSADQFALVCLNLQKQSCEELIRSMKTFTQIAYTVDDVELLLNVKIGHAQYPKHASSLEALVAKAKLALKHQQKRMPYALATYEPYMGETLKKHVHLAQRLKEAVNDDSMQIHFQKIVDVRRAQPIFVEALVRWTDSVYGRINPEEIFEIAETSGMTMMLEKSLLSKATAAYSALKEDPEFKGTQLALNLAPSSLMHRDILPYLQTLLAQHALEARDVTIEISERIFMNDLELCLEQIRAYKETGFKIAIDDFGKDFSSLSILERIDFDIIKIDALFVKNIAIKKTQEIFRMVQRITENTRQFVIVEGVETKDQTHILDALGCYYQQGFHHHYPRPLK